MFKTAVKIGVGLTLGKSLANGLLVTVAYIAKKCIENSDDKNKTDAEE